MNLTAIPALSIVNKRRITRLIRSHPGTSRAEIVRKLGLSTSLVNLYTRDLLQNSWIRTNGKTGERAGRKTDILELIESKAHFLCVHAQIDKVLFSLVDFSGRSKFNLETPLSGVTSQPVFLKELSQAVSVAFQRLPKGIAVDSIIVSLAGQVEFQHGMAFNIEGLAEWETISIENYLKRTLGRAPIVLSHITGILNHYLSLPETGDFLFLKLIGNLAFGCVKDGEVFKGRIGTAGELSHLQLNPAGPLCRCGGRGCLESIPDPVVRWQTIQSTLLPELAERYNIRNALVWTAPESLPSVQNVSGIRVTFVSPGGNEILSGNSHFAAGDYMEKNVH